MPALDSPALIVARFLEANHYNDTLHAFISEAGLPQDAGTIAKGDLTIEQILEEKKVFDLSLNFEKLGVGEDDGNWSSFGNLSFSISSVVTPKTPPYAAMSCSMTRSSNVGSVAPSLPIVAASLPTSSNLLHVSVESVDEETESQLLVATTADRRMTWLRVDASLALHKSHSHVQDSPILSCVTIRAKPLTTVTSAMSGQIVLYDHEADLVLEERRDHTKYVVKVTVYPAQHGAWVATAGWDARIFVYMPKPTSDSKMLRLGSPVAMVSLPTNPEAIVFVEDPDGAAPILIATRRDSTSLHYYSLRNVDTAGPSLPSPVNLELLGTQNLAPHSNAWIAFSPSSVSLCPTDPSLLAVATSSVPHLRLIIAQMLLPASESQSDSASPALTQAAQARESLARQGREDAAIRVNVSTMAPQTQYSTPQVCWRPDGSGVWVNGDDGALRGVEAKTGKIAAVLKGGHEAGSKIRSIWAGWVKSEGRQEEWVVSGGFDKRLIVWKAER